MDTELYTKYIEDVYTGLGFCYSLNPNFKEDAMTTPSWEMLWHYTLVFNDSVSYTDNGPQIRRSTIYGIELADNEIMMDLEKYNKYSARNTIQAI